jgi:glyoxylase-like metal-dependent hydrolase (beta-lactamase superfamily II)
MIRVGDVEIVPVVELEAGAIIQALLPEATPQRLLELKWLMPAYCEPDGRLKAPIQVFVIRSEGRTLLVDTGVGNGKQRIGFPEWSGLETGLIDRLQAAGADPAGVAAVVCTHLHIDHIGWNTSWRDGSWQPTFPYARHLIVADEYERLRSRLADAGADARAAFDDSVRPVIDAGLAELVDRDHRIDGALRFVPTPGHSPAHASIEIVSQGERALISGDIVHHPCQLAFPRWRSAADVDPGLAQVTRLRVLDELAASGTLLIGSHFADPVAGRVVRDGAAFALST